MSNTYVESDYQKVSLKKGLESFQQDGYRAFGWEEKTTDNVLEMRRSRDIGNKNELIRLQRQFEAAVDDIDKMEASKNQAATVSALSVGIAGCVFLALSVFSMLQGHNVAMIILGAIGIGLWIVTYPSSLFFKKRKTEKVTPLITKKYDEAYALCKRADEMTKGGKA